MNKIKLYVNELNKGHTRFTAVPLDILSDKYCGRYLA